jgi:ABC-type branched-subunit amino acid transport system substrate-binding protein
MSDHRFGPRGQVVSSKPAWLRIGVLAALAGCGAVAGACTAALDFTECRSDADCEKFFTADNKPMQCAEFQCVPRDKCEGNSQCAGLGEGFVCTVSGDCVEVVSDNCAAPVYPDGEPGDDVVLIGSIVAKSGADAALGEASEKAILQAVKDFNDAATLQDGKTRVALVACDSKGNVAQARQAARHLGEDLAVPVIIGPLDDDELLDVAENVSVANGVRAFTHSPTATADIDFPDMDLVWQTSVAAAFQGRAIGQLITLDIGAGVLTDPTAVFLFSQDAYGYSMYYALASEKQDGKPNRIPELAGQQLSSYTNAETGAAAIDKYIPGAPPDVLILLGGPEVADLLKHYATKGVPWPTRVYVGHRSAAAVTGLGLAGLADSLRVVGPDLETAQFVEVRKRIDPEGPAEMALAYDATMATLLAMAAIPASSPIAGPTIAKNMARLSDPAGAEISFGEAPKVFVKAAADALKAGMNLELQGASGPLDYVDGGTNCGDLAAFGLDDAGGALAVVARYTADCPETVGNWAAEP